MTRILFVDDESNILHGLRRMLRPMRHEWDLTFAESGEAALEAIDQTTFHIIISDLRMPGMDGAQLLDEVRKRSPYTVRIALSGYAGVETTLGAATHAHQFLTKPCSAEDLTSSIGRAVTLSKLLTDERLRDILSHAPLLPLLQETLGRALERLEDPKVSFSDVAETVGRETGLSAHTLEIMSVSFFQVQHASAAPMHVAALMAMTALKTLILIGCLFDQFKYDVRGGISLSETWRHGLRVAREARLIAADQGCREDIVKRAFLAGLLHDVGRLIFAANFADQYMDIVRRSPEGVPALETLEKETLGATHGEIGAYLMGLWGLAEDIAEAIALHHAPNLSNTDEFGPLAAVHAANALDHAMQTGKPLEDFIDVDYLRRIGLNDLKDALERRREALKGKESLL